MLWIITYVKLPALIDRGDEAAADASANNKREHEIKNTRTMSRFL